MPSHHHDLQRRRLDTLLASDALVSAVFGFVAVLTPHRLFLTDNYNPLVHEGLRLYGCGRLTLAYLLYHVRRVDDGRFRKRVCEGLLATYVLQALVVAKILVTEASHSFESYCNGLALLLLLLFAGLYANFRNGGIKLYELPTAAALQ